MCKYTKFSKIMFKTQVFTSNQCCQQLNTLVVALGWQRG